MRRARKFKEDHINQVITDYCANPDDQPNNNPNLPSEDPTATRLIPENYAQRCEELKDAKTKHAMMQLADYGFYNWEQNMRGCIETNCDLSKIC